MKMSGYGKSNKSRPFADYGSSSKSKSLADRYEKSSDLLAPVTMSPEPEDEFVKQCDSKSDENPEVKAVEENTGSTKKKGIKNHSILKNNSLEKSNILSSFMIKSQ